MPEQIFDAELCRPDAAGTWSYVDVPFDVPAIFGGKARLPVAGTVNGVAFRGSLMPHGDGRFFLVVNQALQKQAGVSKGDTLHVVLDLDTAPRELDVPDDLVAALEAAPEARSRFEAFSYSHRKEYVSWIEEAKKPETRQRRIEKALVMLAEGKKLK